MDLWEASLVMAQLKDGYPDYLVRVDHERMRILVTSECIDDNVPDSELVKTDDGDLWKSFPAAYMVCPNCQGNGSHVDRAIDGNGLSQSDFDEDPEFEEAYFAGNYDVLCEACVGQRVILEAATPEGAEMVQSVMSGYYAGEAEVAAERRMGA